MSSPRLGPLSSSPARTEPESGEELLDQDLVRRDYRAIPELDTYDTKDMDQGDYDPINVDDRRSAEEAMRRRERDERAATGREHIIASEDDEPRRVRRRIDDGDDDDDGAGDGGAGDGGIPPGGAPAGVPLPFGQMQYAAIPGGGLPVGGIPGLPPGVVAAPAVAAPPNAVPRIPEEEDDEEDDGEYVNLDDFRGPIDEFLAMEAPRTEIKRRFRIFLREFVDQHKMSTPLYPRLISQMCSENKQSLEVSYLDLSKAVPILAIWVADEPAVILELFDEEAMSVTLSMFPWYKNVHNFVHVRITNLPIIDRIRDLRQAHLKALIKVVGVVTRRSQVFPQLKHVRFNCNVCGALTGVFPQTGEEIRRPMRCIECQSQPAFTVNTQETIYQNYQTIKLQESPGSVPAGRVPRQKEVVLLHDLIDRVSPGQEVTITGIYNHNYDVALNYLNGFPVFGTQIMANHIDIKGGVGKECLTEQDIQKIIKLSRSPNVGEIIFNSIAPSIHGHEYIKKAIAYSLFSGEPKNVAGGARLRGDINVLILGDPGLAKSQFLKYAQKTAQRSIYTTGKGASAVGLTAGVRRDPMSREWTLEGGALVLADQGICLIDEFDKMNDADRTSIHEAMEQQTISVAKAGIVTTLKARCAVIAAANPIGGRYDSSLNFTDNVNLTDPILSRFDCLCIVRDVVDPEEDLKLAEFVIDNHVKAHRNYQSEPAKKDRPEDDNWEKKGSIDQDLLRKYIIYARQNCHPNLHAINDDKIARLYGELRRASMDTGGIPIAVRHIESLVRMAEANAKIHLRDVISEDVDMAIKVMLHSFMESQKFQVKRSLQKQFAKYLNVSKDSFELLLYVLNSHVKEHRNIRNLQRGTRRVDPSQPEEAVVISQVEFEQRAAELEIVNLAAFYKSPQFTNNGFTLDSKKKTITKAYGS